MARPMTSSYEPRTIALGAELIHPPIQLEVAKAQEIHNELYHRRELAYQNFQVAQDGIQMSNLAMQPGQVQAAILRPDRLILREEFSNGTVEDFATRLVNVASLTWKHLGIHQCVAQVIFARSLVSPQHYSDSREMFVKQVLSGSGEALQTFGRPLAQTSLQLSFAAPDPTQPQVDLRVAPWLQEPRSMWFEVVGKFTAPLTADQAPQLGDHLYSTYRFLTGPALDWLHRHDHP